MCTYVLKHIIVGMNAYIYYLKIVLNIENNNGRFEKFGPSPHIRRVELCYKFHIGIGKQMYS